MRRRYVETPGESDGLQTDVMRFMAIIGFCLIAVLAMVRGQAERHEEPPAVHEADNVRGVEMPAVEAAAPAESESPPPAPPPPPAERPPLLADARLTDGQAEMETPAQQEPEQEIARETLLLRFESKRAFLSLIRRREIELFASTGTGFLRLDADFRIEKAQPPGALYELRSASVPAEVRRLFERRTPSRPDEAGEAEAAGSSPRYLVALPPTMADALAAMVTRLEGARGTGALIIDGRGRIRHEQHQG